MWRSVPGKNGGSKSLDTDQVQESVGCDYGLDTKIKPVRAVKEEEEKGMVRKAYVVVATFAMVTLLLLFGFAFAHTGGHGATSSRQTPAVLRYLRTTTLNTDVLTASKGRDENEDTIESELDSLNHFHDPPDAPWNTTREGCNPSSAKLKVFVYDLPARFHYGMLAEGDQLFATEEMSGTWPRALPHYPGGLYQQHSPEYWLISDLITSEMHERRIPCTAFRVSNWEDADVILVPFFASLSYNKYGRRIGGRKRVGMDRDKVLQRELVAFLKAQRAWEARREDHVVVMHHPNSLAAMRTEIGSVMFVVADFGRYDAEVASLRKDVVAPYKHVVATFGEDLDGEASFAARTTLLFFQGAVVRKEGGVIRQQLRELLKVEPDVVFVTGATTSVGIRSAMAGMRGSKFCLHLAGDTPSSNRLFDAVASGCVPLIISDAIELPFEDVLDYSEFCLFLKESDALRRGVVTNLLREFPAQAWARMHARLRKVARHFEWQYPSQAGDAVHMTWEAIARKLPALTLARHKRHRYARSHSSPATA